MSDVWTDARVARLKELWSEGYTASQIADDLGSVITRNAVMGQIHRLKLGGKGGSRCKDAPLKAPSKDPKPRVSKPRRPSNPPTMGRRNPSNDIVARLKIAATEPGLPARLEEPAIGSGIPFMALRNDTCRWPFGNPLSSDFYFCGVTEANLKDRRPYCPFHTRKASQRMIVDAEKFAKSAFKAAAGVTPKSKGAHHGQGY